MAGERDGGRDSGKPVAVREEGDSDDSADSDPGDSTIKLGCGNDANVLSDKPPNGSQSTASGGHAARRETDNG